MDRNKFLFEGGLSVNINIFSFVQFGLGSVRPIVHMGLFPGAHFGILCTQMAHDMKTKFLRLTLMEKNVQFSS